MNNMVLGINMVVQGCHQAMTKTVELYQMWKILILNKRQNFKNFDPQKSFQKVKAAEFPRIHKRSNSHGCQ